MSPQEWLPLLFFAAFIVCLMTGYPVAFALGGMSLIFGVCTSGMDFLSLMPSRIWSIMEGQVLLAVPLFIFMGVMLEKSGIAEELLETVGLIFGPLRGGLAIGVVLVGALLAASTGIIGATVVTMGLLSLPTMLKRGYHPGLASGTICASGTLGQIIPPSVALILLGERLNVPVGDMFIGALVPGVVLVGIYLIYILAISFAKPSWAPAMPSAELAAFSGRAMWLRLAKAFFPPVVLMTAVLGSIFKGIASPTEAAAVGAFGASVLTAFKGQLRLKTLQAVMRETTQLTSMAFIILIGAAAFSLVFRGMQGDDHMQAMILRADFEPRTFLLIIMLIIFVAGFFIDFMEITFIIVPLVVPLYLAVHPEADKLWLGVLIAMNLQTSFLTPPFGFALFYLKAVSPPGVKTTDIYLGVLPYIAMQLVGLVVVAYWPELVLWLPHQLAGSHAP
jgi:tripartite ATP-independent transporter DctM subunit